MTLFSLFILLYTWIDYTFCTSNTIQYLMQ